MKALDVIHLHLQFPSFGLHTLAKASSALNLCLALLSVASV